MNDIYIALAEHTPSPAGVFGSAPWATVPIVGPDAVEFLHRICSQDVEGLAIGRTAPAAFLTPKGQLVATGVLARRDDGVVVEVASSLAGALYAYLDRFHFTERLEIGRPDEGAACVEVDGPGAWGVAGCDAGGWADDGGVLRIAGERAGLRWVHAHGPEPVVAAWRDALGLPALDRPLVDCLHMATGRLVVGRDTDERTIALEAPVEDHISTSKGCYTGQEIVARIHTYGHVNRRLVLLTVDGAEPIEPGAALDDRDGDPCGRVTSSVPLPGDASVRLAWGYVPRELAERGTELQLAGRAAQVVGFGPA